MKRIKILVSAAFMSAMLALAVTLSSCSLLKTDLNTEAEALNDSANTNADNKKTSSDKSNTKDENNNSDDKDGKSKATIAKTIDTDGTYTLTGTINGQILVTAENVTLILDGVEIKCADGSAILGKDGNGTDLTQTLTVELKGKNTINSSKHGIQVKENLIITGTGSASISSEKDGLNGNNITVESGTLEIAVEDDGIHADEDLKINGGEITIKKSNEALEGNNIYISNGTMDLVSTDDGINASTESTEETNGGDFGRGGFGGGFGGGDNTIDISGGTVKLFAGGDGMDSNGTINISGGTVIAIINSSADNSALDCDGELTITGGTVIAGGTGTYESVSGNSTQSYVYLNNIAANAEIEILSENETLVSYAAERDISMLVIFAKGITSGQSYTVLKDGENSQVEAGTGGGRNMGGMGGPGGGRGYGNPPNRPRN